MATNQRAVIVNRIKDQPALVSDQVKNQEDYDKVVYVDKDEGVDEKRDEERDEEPQD